MNSLAIFTSMIVAYILIGVVVALIFEAVNGQREPMDVFAAFIIGWPGVVAIWIWVIVGRFIHWIEHGRM